MCWDEQKLEKYGLSNSLNNPYWISYVPTDKIHIDGPYMEIDGFI